MLEFHYTNEYIHVFSFSVFKEGIDFLQKFCISEKYWFWCRIACCIFLIAVIMRLKLTLKSDTEIINVNKLKTEVTALKIYVTEQLYIIKQSVGERCWEGGLALRLLSVCNCSSKNNIYIDSHHNQINYMRVENMKNSIIQSLLCHSPSKNVNDKGDNSSPISKKAENDHLIIILITV